MIQIFDQIFSDSFPESAPSTPLGSNKGIRTVPIKYINATSISSDEFFGTKKKKEGCNCCCIV